jgi:GrpB-like predicted nucleotidyltransferase (UPF0157 family)
MSFGEMTRSDFYAHHTAGAKIEHTRAQRLRQAAKAAKARRDFLGALKADCAAREARELRDYHKAKAREYR